MTNERTEVERLRDAVEQLRQETGQLRGNLSLAEEGLANYAQEVERLKAHEHVAATILATALACDNYQPQHMEWMAEAARWLNEPRASHEPGAGASTYIGYPDGSCQMCGNTLGEHVCPTQGASQDAPLPSGINESLDRAAEAIRQGRMKIDAALSQGATQAINSIDDVAAICHSVTGLCCHILGSPGGPCTIGNCAAVRGYLGGPEFAQSASRDAAESWRTALQDVSPADLVGALQDVVHTDPGPVRAGKAYRDASSVEATRVTVGCSQCTATVSLPQRDGLVDIASLGLWYFSTPTGWRCPAHAPAQRTSDGQ